MKKSSDSEERAARLSHLWSSLESGACVSVRSKSVVVFVHLFSACSLFRWFQPFGGLGGKAGACRYLCESDLN